MGAFPLRVAFLTGCTADFTELGKAVRAACLLGVTCGGGGNFLPALAAEGRGAEEAGGPPAAEVGFAFFLR